MIACAAEFQDSISLIRESIDNLCVEEWEIPCDNSAGVSYCIKQPHPSSHGPTSSIRKTEDEEYGSVSYHNQITCIEPNNTRQIGFVSGFCPIEITFNTSSGGTTQLIWEGLAGCQERGWMA